MSERPARRTLLPLLLSVLLHAGVLVALLDANTPPGDGTPAPEMVVEMIVPQPPPPLQPPPPQPEPQRPPPPEATAAPPPPAPQLQSAHVAAKSSRPAPQPARPAAAPPAEPTPPPLPLPPVPLAPPAPPVKMTLSPDAEAGHAKGGDDGELSQSEHDFILAQIVKMWRFNYRAGDGEGLTLDAVVVIQADGTLSGPLNKDSRWDPAAVIPGWADLLRSGQMYRREGLESFLLALRMAQPLRLPPGGKWPRRMALRFRLKDL